MPGRSTRDCPRLSDKADAAPPGHWRFAPAEDDDAPQGARVIAFADGSRLIGRLAQGPALDAPVSAGDDALSIEIATIPTGAPRGLVERIEAEIAGAARQDWPLIDFTARTRVLWSLRRAAVFGAPEQFDDALPALAALSFLAQGVSSLESEARAVFAGLERDAGLTHAVGASDLARQGHVDAMTRRGWRLRTGQIALTRLAERPCEMTPAALRLFRELALQISLEERLAALEDMIECIQDLYESATDRLTEFRYFHTEYRVEILILIVLLAELLLLARDFIG
jgi:hypothetical protein